jgi:hypothetical protein
MGIWDLERADFMAVAPREGAGTLVKAPLNCGVCELGDYR